MPELSRHANTPTIQFRVQDHPQTDTFVHANTQNIIHILGYPERVFSHGHHVRIVINKYRDLQHFLQNTLDPRLFIRQISIRSSLPVNQTRKSETCHLDLRPINVQSPDRLINLLSYVTESRLIILLFQNRGIFQNTLNRFIFQIEDSHPQVLPTNIHT